MTHIIIIVVQIRIFGFHLGLLNLDNPFFFSFCHPSAISFVFEIFVFLIVPVRSHRVISIRSDRTVQVLKRQPRIKTRSVNMDCSQTSQTGHITYTAHYCNLTNKSRRKYPNLRYIIWSPMFKDLPLLLHELPRKVVLWTTNLVLWIKDILREFLIQKKLVLSLDFRNKKLMSLLSPNFFRCHFL